MSSELCLRHEQCKGFAKDIPIVLPKGNVDAVVGDHADGTNREQIVQNNVVRGADSVLNPDHARLTLAYTAVWASTTLGRVVVEEAVQTSTINDYVAAVNDA